MAIHCRAVKNSLRGTVTFISKRKMTNLPNLDTSNNYLLTYDSYGKVHNRCHRGECITWASGGEGALDTPGPLNGIERSQVRVNVLRANVSNDLPRVSS